MVGPRHMGGAEAMLICSVGVKKKLEEVIPNLGSKKPQISEDIIQKGP